MKNKLFILAVSILACMSAYAQESIDSAREKVLSYNAEDKFINFAFITDVHTRGKEDLGRYSEPCLEHFVSLCNERYCDFAAFGGDLYSAYGATWKDAVKLMPESLKYFNRIEIPVFMTKGNHDRNGKLTQEETISCTQYHLLCETHTGDADVHFNPEDPYGNYYYADFQLEKVRVIILNYFDASYLQKAGVHDKQLDWLETQALNPQTMGEGWTVLMFSHNYKWCSERFWALLERLNASGSACVGGLIYGDLHKDKFSNEHGVNQICVRCGYCQKEQLGTPEEDSFSVFTLDTKARILHETRVGCGQNRDFPY